jgi:hypothetical protein
LIVARDRHRLRGRGRWLDRGRFRNRRGGGRGGELAGGPQGRHPLDRDRIAHPGGLLVPGLGERLIELHAMAAGIHVGDVAHRERQVLVGRQLVPIGGGGVVLVDSEAMVIKRPDAVLRGRVAGLGERLPLLQR